MTPKGHIVTWILDGSAELLHSSASISEEWIMQIGSCAVTCQVFALLVAVAVGALMMIRGGSSKMGRVV